MESGEDLPEDVDPKVAERGVLAFDGECVEFIECSRLMVSPAVWGTGGGGLDASFRAARRSLILAARILNVS